LEWCGQLNLVEITADTTPAVHHVGIRLSINQPHTKYSYKVLQVPCYVLSVVEVHISLLYKNLVNVSRIVSTVLFGELKLTLLNIHLQQRRFVIRRAYVREFIIVIIILLLNYATSNTYVMQGDMRWGKWA
jgi:hypothetical protein